MNLRLETRSVDSKVSIIDLQGEIDVFTAPQLKQRILEMLDQGVIHLIVNLSGVEYLDSAALGVLIGGLKRLRERDGSLSIICPNMRIKRIFEITGLDKIFDIYATEGEAVKSLKAKEVS
ncbi:MAG: STAS domain-containing protein [Armatimonadota bacterium]|nr:STAS domain-containing protein [Armatimonadota bacterium]MDH7480368.1 STAS domain-containing protein [Armatimonadota bacterium]